VREKSALDRRGRVRRAGAVIWEENPRREKFLEAMLGKMQEGRRI
jgi:hypothetical protein